MKKSSGITAVLGVVACILLVVVIVVFISEDRKGPIITIDEHKVAPYSKDQGLDILKGYANAVDERDGDVSDSIVVENVYVMPDFTKAKVIYVAKDKSGNVTKKDYIIEYNATEEEKNAAVKSENNDKKSSDDNSQQQTAPTTQTSVAATDNNAASSTQASQAESTTDVSVPAGSPKLVLSSTQATVQKGAYFNISNYVQEMTDDKDGADVLSRRLIVNGDYNTSVSGDYTLDVYCTDRDRNESNHVKFTLHVN